MKIVINIDPRSVADLQELVDGAPGAPVIRNLNTGHEMGTVTYLSIEGDVVTAEVTPGQELQAAGPLVFEAVTANSSLMYVNCYDA